MEIEEVDSVMSSTLFLTFWLFFPAVVKGGRAVLCVQTAGNLITTSCVYGGSVQERALASKTS